MTSPCTGSALKVQPTWNSAGMRAYDSVCSTEPQGATSLKARLRFLSFLVEGYGVAASALGCAASVSWWSGRESNPRPLHCERSALPTELPPHEFQESEDGNVRDPVGGFKHLLCTIEIPQILRHSLLSIRYSKFPMPCRLLPVAEIGRCPMSNTQCRISKLLGPRVTEPLLRGGTWQLHRCSLSSPPLLRRCPVRSSAQGARREGPGSSCNR
jgi:hypothetical protein